MTDQLPVLKALARLSPPLVSTQLGLGMIFSPATTLFQQKLVDMVGFGRYLCHNLCLSWALVRAGHDEWDQGASQELVWVGVCSTCQVLVYVEPQRLSGAGLCSACQVLVDGELAVLVRC